MSGISTHILDTMSGRPAAGVGVQLFNGDRMISTAVTNDDGRVSSLLPRDYPLAAGTYRIVFAVGARWPDGFYPEVSVTFAVRDLSSHYHVPLLISPFGFTTYRGS
jgi:5-hydroxyisourate hydrolase